MASLSRVYLISKYGDVVVGIATGFLAYSLYERKTFRKDGEKLADLVQWKWDQRQKRKEAVVAVEQEGWDELERELKIKQEAARAR
ncbi:SPOSA6832_01822 [Sporobolomyces salmonicolor]|uniref:SPOSA6832_01822-mRNA-1:cds n=1 Tax=Sporidiobolus salmonicolor TaxID=5005 RepID=A0A0D6EKU1_SPOSA|nr:SPOSA6832_01822 [Sporobolomyces salmonicolor]